MPNFENRWKKIFSDDIIPEKEHDFSEKIILKSNFVLTFFTILKVLKMVHEMTEGYIHTIVILF